MTISRVEISDDLPSSSTANAGAAGGAAGSAAGSAGGAVPEDAQSLRDDDLRYLYGACPPVCAE